MRLQRASAVLSLLLAAACSAPEARAPHAPVLAGVRQPLVVRDLEGQVHDLDRTLADGQALALVFWQTWCASCRSEAPGLVEAARRHAGRVAFVGVVPGSDERVDEREVRRVAGELGFTFPQVRDRDLVLTERFAVEGTPTILVLEGNGELVYRGHRAPPDWNAFSGR